MDISKLSKPGKKAYNNNLIHIGSKFGRFTVQSITGQYDKHIYVNALCECGVCKVVILKDLKSGISKSCGCLRNENIRKHGKSKTPLYYVWVAMLGRCYKEKNVAYSSYGGVGISVCEDWKKFLKFEEWSLNNGYIKSLQIDRVDCFGNYEPSNCRYVSGSVNSNNKKNSVRVLLDGVVMTAPKASLALGRHKSYVIHMKNGHFPNPFPERLQFLGSYEVWSKLYPESR